MDGWLVAFIILCLFFGPGYIITAIIGFLVATAPGTKSAVSIMLYIFMLIIFGSPFIFTGYMAVVSHRRGSASS